MIDRGDNLRLTPEPFVEWIMALFNGNKPVESAIPRLVPAARTCRGITLNLTRKSKYPNADRRYVRSFDFASHSPMRYAAFRTLMIVTRVQAAAEKTRKGA